MCARQWLSTCLLRKFNFYQRSEWRQIFLIYSIFREVNPYAAVSIIKCYIIRLCEALPLNKRVITFCDKEQIFTNLTL